MKYASWNQLESNLTLEPDMARHTLLIDADDTLWENNIFFEKTISHFISELEHLGYTPEYLRHILNETERRNIRQHGYGVRSFRRSLEETYLKLAGNMARREIIKDIDRISAELENTPPHILGGVPETLAYLAKRHRLILLSKGEQAEQAAKVERSGLQSYFDAIEIVMEKDSKTYDRIIEQFQIVKSHGWMVGNNPRTDINLALQAGLNAVLIPHAATWEAEKAELESGTGKVIILPAFRELRSHF
jgi:putative hydrolase of the HAD superfamily